MIRDKSILLRSLEKIILPEREHVEVVKNLGSGKAARVLLVKRVNGELVAEKQFVHGNILTRGLYKLCFQAPLPYRTNRFAIASAYYTRKVVMHLTEFWFGTPRVADARYIRWDDGNCGWVLGTEYIEGRGPNPLLRNGNYEIFELEAFMDRLRDHLMESGLYGPIWQSDKSLSVPTSNFLLNGKNEWIWIDLEAAVPNLRFIKNKSYLKESKMEGFSPLFGDIDFDKLFEYMEKNRDRIKNYKLLKSYANKLRHFMVEWKYREIAIFRTASEYKIKESEKKKRNMEITNQYLDAWREEYGLSYSMEIRIRRSRFFLLLFMAFADLFYIVLNRQYFNRWIEQKYQKLEDRGRIPAGYRKNITINWIMSKFLFKELQLWLLDPHYKEVYKSFGVFYFDQKIKDFETKKRLSEDEIVALRSGMKVSAAYMKGFGYHLLIKPISLYTDTISIGGVIVTGSWEPLLIMLITPAMRVVATLILWIQEWLKGERLKIGIALVVGGIPKFGIFGFPAQMYRTEHAIFRLLSISTLSGMGKKVPVFGEDNSTLEHWFIRRYPGRKLLA